MDTITNILRIDGSARRTGSTSRALTDELIDHIAGQGPVTLTVRDLAEPISHVDEEWIAANFTAPDARTPEQKRTLALSDRLVAEIEAADLIIIGTPVYNFAIPAAMKAWVDQIGRVGRTFRYTETGPEGLMTGKRAIIVAASGGTPAGSEIDFATPYLRHMLGFIGIEDVTVIAADQLAMDADSSIAQARGRIAELA